MRRVVLAVLVLGMAAAAGGCAAGGKVLYRVNCGATSEYTDEAGEKWLADQVTKPDARYGAVGGLTILRETLKTIPGTPAPEVYRNERYSMTAYEFAVPNGQYAVRLHFCETFGGIKDVGQRVFSVKVQGKDALKDLDVFKEAGGFAKPLVKEVRGVAVTDGKLKVEFVPNVQNPEINGIEVLQE